MYTEEEAKTKWCPFARQLVSIETDDPLRKGPQFATSANRYQNNDMAACISSACMAWCAIHQWRYHSNEPWLTGDDGGGAVEERTVGFCGLIGKP